MRLAILPNSRMVRPMQVYTPKTTREDKPTPEIRWIVGEDVRLIGFDEFKCQVRLSIARLDDVDCDVSGERPTEFFTEVPAIDQLTDLVNDSEVVIDTESSQSHINVYTNDFKYKIKKIPGSEPLEFRKRYLPIDQPIAKGSISSEQLCHCINLSPDELLRVKITDTTIEFVSRSTDEKVRYCFTDTGTVYPDTIEHDCSLDVELLSKTIRKFPKNKTIQFFVTDEFIRFRYELGDIGYMNYYQRIKNSNDTYVI